MKRMHTMHLHGIAEDMVTVVSFIMQKMKRQLQAAMQVKTTMMMEEEDDDDEDDEQDGAAAADDDDDGDGEEE